MKTGEEIRNVYYREMHTLKLGKFSNCDYNQEFLFMIMMKADKILKKLDKCKCCKCFKED